MSSVAAVTLHLPSRFPQVARAARSVASQTHANVQHHILVDGEILDSHVPYYEKLQNQYGVAVSETDLDVSENSPWHRVRNLREIGLQVTESEYIVWLDDDNWWDDEHVESLLQNLNEREFDLVHSHRTLWTPVGRPYPVNRNPWHEDSSKYLTELWESEIASPYSPIMRDTTLAKPIDGYHGTIDIGEWLFPRSLAESIGMPEPKDGKSVDDLILQEISRRNLTITDSGRATLNYTVGVEL